MQNNNRPVRTQNRPPYGNQRPMPQKRRHRKKKSPLKKYGSRFLLFLFFFAIISLICLSLFFLNLTKIKSPPAVSYTINTVEIKNNKPTPVSSTVSLSYDIGFANGQFYFPVNNILKKMDFILIGDKTERSFTRAASGEYIKFIIGTTVAYINNEEYRLTGPSFSDSDNNIYVPLEFLENTFENLVFSFDEKNKNKITVDLEEITGNCFKISKAKKLTAVEESPYFGSSPVNFISDLSAYEQYFNPPAEQADEYIVLINQTNPLIPQDYIPPDLVDVIDTRQDRAMRKLREYPAKALEAFLIEARANGYTNVTVTSAYRSYAEQTQIFNQELERIRPTYGDDAEEIVAVAIAYPGQSEHQSGLSLDMHNATSAGQTFGTTAEGKWLAENAHYFGFILRYPEDKTEITGIKYEPWHFRYVGRFHATRIYDLGLCLEEYWEQHLKK